MKNFQQYLEETFSKTSDDKFYEEFVQCFVVSPKADTKKFLKMLDLVPYIRHIDDQYTEAGIKALVKELGNTLDLSNTIKFLVYCYQGPTDRIEDDVYKTNKGVLVNLDNYQSIYCDCGGRFDWKEEFKIQNDIEEVTKEWADKVIKLAGVNLTVPEDFEPQLVINAILKHLK